MTPIKIKEVEVLRMDNKSLLLFKMKISNMPTSQIEKYIATIVKSLSQFKAGKRDYPVGLDILDALEKELEYRKYLTMLRNLPQEEFDKLVNKG